jgi:hypothetical protein
MCNLKTLARHVSQYSAVNIDPKRRNYKFSWRQVILYKPHLGRLGFNCTVAWGESALELLYVEPPKNKINASCTNIRV